MAGLDFDKHNPSALRFPHLAASTATTATTNSPRDFDEDKALIIEESCSCNSQSPLNKKRSVHFYVLFSLLNITIACVTVYSNANANAHSRRPQAVGWNTELHDARSSIEYEERSYTGALTYDYEQQAVVKLNDSDLEFFGPPSTRIDDAWDYLLHDEFPAMTEEEAAPFGSELQPFPGDHKYHFEYFLRNMINFIKLIPLTIKKRPDIFHNLHCINAIRMKFNHHVYGDSSESVMKHESPPESVVGPNYEITHYEHCLDRLRQAIMCHGDLTPSPMYIFEGLPIALGKSGKHTCRKFEPIREWMDRKAEEKGAFGHR